MGGGPSSPRIDAVVINAFPRRQPGFLLRFFAANGVLLGTLRVPNTLPRLFPEWRPQPLPQTATNGPVTLTLKSLEERENSYGPWLAPEWNLKASEPAWGRGHVRYFKVLDATGNEGGVLSTNEPAWKINAQVYRNGVEDFTSKERLTLTNLAVPATNQFISIDQSADCDGVGVKVLVLVNAGELVISNGVPQFMKPVGQASTGHSYSTSSGYGQTPGSTNESWGALTPFFLVKVQGAQNEDEIEFHLRDDRGQEVKVSVNGYDGLPNGERMYHPEFTPPPEAKILGLDVVVNRPLIFGFMVNPADVKRGKP